MTHQIKAFAIYVIPSRGNATLESCRKDASDCPYNDKYAQAESELPIKRSG
jgi:hypothetical protein